jgi:hypothetical protein
MSDAFHTLSNLQRERRLAFWYCQGEPYNPGSLTHLRKVMPDILIEYYDGLGSYIAAFEQETKHLAMEDAHGTSGLRQLAIQRLMRPDLHFMPVDGLWERYSSPQAQARSKYMPLNLIQGKIRLVGETINSIDGMKFAGEHGPDVVLIMAKLSEIRREVALDDELRMYDDLLAAIRSVSKNISILAKTHPRSSPEKMHRLRQICISHDVQLYNGQQLFEYIVDKSGKHDVVVIGSHSTALLSTIQFGYGRALCLSQAFMASYIGPHYGNDSWQTVHHQVMEVAAVTIISSLSELTALLREKT